MSGAAVLEEMTKFDPAAMNHVEVTEKVTLPSVEDIETEKKHISLIDGVENFTKEDLKPTETKEKIVLPTAEDIENEKKCRE